MPFFAEPSGERGLISNHEKRNTTTTYENPNAKCPTLSWYYGLGFVPKLCSYARQSVD
jgi:hypothetical protein